MTKAELSELRELREEIRRLRDEVTALRMSLPPYVPQYYQPILPPPAWPLGGTLCNAEPFDEVSSLRGTLCATGGHS